MFVSKCDIQHTKVLARIAKISLLHNSREICICCILCIFVLLCVYCCSYFRCRSAG